MFYFYYPLRLLILVFLLNSVALSSHAEEKIGSKQIIDLGLFKMRVIPKKEINGFQRAKLVDLLTDYVDGYFKVYSFEWQESIDSNTKDLPQSILIEVIEEEITSKPTEELRAMVLDFFHGGDVGLYNKKLFIAVSRKATAWERKEFGQTIPRNQFFKVTHYPHESVQKYIDDPKMLSRLYDKLQFNPLDYSVDIQLKTEEELKQTPDVYPNGTPAQLASRTQEQPFFWYAIIGSLSALLVGFFFGFKMKA